MQHCAFVVPAVPSAFATLGEAQTNFGLRPPHLVASSSQQVPARQEAAFLAHFVEAAEVFTFIPAFIPVVHMASAHVALSVQQASFPAASSTPAMPALVGSWYFVEAHATVLPPHFVVSISQHTVGEQEAAFDVHFVSAAEVFAFVAPKHVAAAHVATSVQQAAIPAFAL